MPFHPRRGLQILDLRGASGRNTLTPARASRAGTAYQESRHGRNPSSPHCRRKLRPGKVSRHHPDPMGGGRRSVGPLVSPAGPLAGPRDRSDVGRGRRGGRRTRARHRRRRRRTDAGGRASCRTGRPRACHRHLAHHPALRQDRRGEGRPGERRDPRAGRRTPRPVAGGLFRCGDLARRPDLLPRPAARTGGHTARPAGGRPLCCGGVLHAGEESLLCPAGRHYSPSSSRVSTFARPAFSAAVLA